MRQITREQFRDELVPVARKLLEDIGIEPYSLHDECRSWKKFVVEAIDNFHGKNWQEFCQAGGPRATFRVVSGWGSLDLRAHWTGRVHRLGQLVWVHDREDRGHPIVAKAAILCLCDDMQMKRHRRRSYVYSGSRTNYMRADGFLDFTKLYCLEPIAEEDHQKTAEEMQAELGETKRLCQDLESHGQVTLRMFIEDVSVARLKVELFGAYGEWVAEDRELMSQMMKQVEADEGKPIGELPVTTVLSTESLTKYLAWKEHNPILSPES